MRSASLFLAGIIAWQFGFAALSEAQHWLYFPDASIPLGLQIISKCYWLGIVGFIYCWCRADAKSRHLVIPVATSLFVPLLFPLGVPYYYLHTYPTRRAFAHIGMFLIFVASCVVVLWAGHMVAFDYYAIWTNHPASRR